MTAVYIGIVWTHLEIREPQCRNRKELWQLWELQIPHKNHASCPPTGSMKSTAGLILAV